ncbi:hypothetical protein B0H34DRAFT_735334 [Crassisporium funariophilum]|nr:hypothetical protein B0H34DRAFT_739637 [Crassisporium funariophilum]KAF8148803.1 hypothetical protein B0H34DRAFT_735334 [Crassisporium funariophilum]
MPASNQLSPIDPILRGLSTEPILGQLPATAMRKPTLAAITSKLQLTASDLKAVQRRFKELEVENATLKANHQLLEGKVEENLKKTKMVCKNIWNELGQVKHALENSKKRRRDDEDEDEDDEGVGSSSEEDEDERKVKEVVEAGEQSKRYAATNAFKQAMGCPTLKGKDLPPYPEIEEEWPLRPSDSTKMTRFCWDRPFNNKDNWKNILKISAEILQNGAQALPEAAKAITKVSEKDRIEKVRKKFTTLAQAYKTKIKKETVVVVSDESDGDADEVCLCKCEALPTDHRLRSKQYDTAMVATLMSDDKDAYDDLGKEIPHRFVSRPPAYRSQALETFYRDLDKEKDPQPGDRYLERVVGETKDTPPPASSSKFKNKARRWMVSTVWLAKDGNGKYNDGQIIDSGILWGDAKDPEDVQRLLKWVKLEKEEQAVKKEKDTLKTGMEKLKGKGKAKAKAKNGANLGPSTSRSWSGPPSDMYDLG